MDNQLLKWKTSSKIKYPYKKIENSILSLIHFLHYSFEKYTNSYLYLDNFSTLTILSKKEICEIDIYTNIYIFIDFIETTNCITMTPDLKRHNFEKHQSTKFNYKKVKINGITIHLHNKPVTINSAINVKNYMLNIVNLTVGNFINNADPKIELSLIFFEDNFKLLFLNNVYDSLEIIIWNLDKMFNIGKTLEIYPIIIFELMELYYFFSIKFDIFTKNIIKLFFNTNEQKYSVKSNIVFSNEIALKNLERKNCKIIIRKILENFEANGKIEILIKIINTNNCKFIQKVFNTVGKKIINTFYPNINTIIKLIISIWIANSSVINFQKMQNSYITNKQIKFDFFFEENNNYNDVFKITTNCNIQKCNITINNKTFEKITDNDNNKTFEKITDNNDKTCENLTDNDNNKTFEKITDTDNNKTFENLIVNNDKTCENLIVNNDKTCEKLIINNDKTCEKLIVNNDKTCDDKICENLIVINDKTFENLITDNDKTFEKITDNNNKTCENLIVNNDKTGDDKTCDDKTYENLTCDDKTSETLSDNNDKPSENLTATNQSFNIKNCEMSNEESKDYFLDSDYENSLDIDLDNLICLEEEDDNYSENIYKSISNLQIIKSENNSINTLLNNTTIIDLTSNEQFYLKIYYSIIITLFTCSIEHTYDNFMLRLSYLAIKLNGYNKMVIDDLKDDLVEILTIYNNYKFSYSVQISDFLKIVNNEVMKSFCLEVNNLIPFFVKSDENNITIYELQNIPIYICENLIKNGIDFDNLDILTCYNLFHHTIGSIKINTAVQKSFNNIVVMKENDNKQEILSDFEIYNSYKQKYNEIKKYTLKFNIITKRNDVVISESLSGGLKCELENAVKEGNNFAFCVDNFDL